MDGLSAEDEHEIERFPAVLHALIEAERTVGNHPVEVGHSFPAPPVGAYVMLSGPVTSRPRASGGGVSFRDRDNSTCRGEYTDEDRFFFVLEPPGPPPPMPDMDAIRRAHDLGEQRAVAAMSSPAAAVPGGSAPAGESTVDRFRSSMEITYEKWHDGIGYDVDVLDHASADERAEIERMLVARGVSDWRDVEALAALDTEATRAVLVDAAADGSHEIRLAVARMAPQLIDAEQRTASLVHTLETATILDGLSGAIDQAAEFHPPAVVEALLRGALMREGEAAVHFAALVMFVHGVTEEPFDWAERPFFLRFHAVGDERRLVFEELCRRIGVDPEPFRHR